MTTHTRITPSTLVRSADMGRATTVRGVTLTTRVSSADTAAAFVLLHVSVPPYWDGCAAHWHAHTTEVIYVLNGTLACTLDDTTTTASNGTALLIPPGVVHTIWNPTAAPATYLAWFSPGGVAHYDDRVSVRHTAEPVQVPGGRGPGATLSATDDVLLVAPDQGAGPQPV